MDRKKFTLALGLILFYMAVAVTYNLVVPDASEDTLGKKIDFSLLGQSVLLLVVIAVTTGWRSVGLIGRDMSPAIRWIVGLFILQLVYLAMLLAVAALGYDGKKGSIGLIMINIAFVAFNEEVLFRGFLWDSVSGWNPAKRILFVSALFGLFHLTNLSGGAEVGSTIFQVVITFLAGIFDAVIRYGTGSLIPTILTHFLWDVSGELTGEGLGALLAPVGQFLFIALGLIGLGVIAKNGKQPVPAQ